jgi:hypothetical protein
MWADMHIEHSRITVRKDPAGVKQWFIVIQGSPGTGDPAALAVKLS